jgi:hypothetical protein
MNTDNQKKIREMLDRVFDPLNKAAGYKSYEDGMKAFRELFRDKAASPAAWLLKQARETYSIGEAVSVRPEFFYEILGQVGTLEAFVSKNSGLAR